MTGTAVALLDVIVGGLHMAGIVAGAVGLHTTCLPNPLAMVSTEMETFVRV